MSAVSILTFATSRADGFWSPSPLPARGGMPYVARHGFGYSIFEYEEDGIATELCIYVATDAPVKFAKLRITNRSGRMRQLSVTAIGMGARRIARSDADACGDGTGLHQRSAVHPATPITLSFPTGSHSSTAAETARTITADRTEFLGRNGSAAAPAALRRVRLSGRVGAGLDPCSAIQVQAEVENGQTREIVFTLGVGADEEQARQLVYRVRGFPTPTGRLRVCGTIGAARWALPISRRPIRR